MTLSAVSCRCRFPAARCMGFNSRFSTIPREIAPSFKQPEQRLRIRRQSRHRLPRWRRIMRVQNPDALIVRPYAKVLIALLMLGVSSGALADWHAGTITQLGIGYDGSTVTFRLSGWSRTNCTCSSAWPNQMCLDRSRLASEVAHDRTERAGSHR